MFIYKIKENQVCHKILALNVFYMDDRNLFCTRFIEFYFPYEFLPSVVYDKRTSSSSEGVTSDQLEHIIVNSRVDARRRDDSSSNVFGKKPTTFFFVRNPRLFFSKAQYTTTVYMARSNLDVAGKPTS